MTEKIDAIYLFGYSPKQTKRLERLFPILKNHHSKGKKIGLILIHDGVIGTIPKDKVPKEIEMLINQGILVYAMIPDLKARGIETKKIYEKIKTIEYDDLIDIMDEANKIISWM